VTSHCAWSEPGEATALVWAIAYAAFGFAVLPVDARKAPLIVHGFKDASREPQQLASWWRTWPAADIGGVVPPGMMVVDLDEKGAWRGIQDFLKLDGRHPDAVTTPQATSPSGGRHLFFAAGDQPRKQGRIPGTGVDLIVHGLGYAVLPHPGNGRLWLTPLSTPFAPAPAGIAEAARKVRPAVRDLEPVTSRLDALTALQHAVAKIVGARRGEQESTRHAQCFRIGVLIAEGVLDYDTAHRALVAAAEAMPAYGSPWRGLEAKVEASIARGIAAGGGAP
jgi:hypothetical protein